MLIHNNYDAAFVNRVKYTKEQVSIGNTDYFVNSQTFSNILAERQNSFPYGNLAEDGIIDYNGVIFVGDPKTNTISLGDVSNPQKVLTISLPSGGSLKVNVDNLGELAQAADMFSPEDLNAIMRAIRQYNYCERKLNEIEDDNQKQTTSIADEFKMQMQAFIEEHAITPEKTKKEEDWREMSDEEWDKLVEDFDKYMDEVKEELERMGELQEEAAKKGAVEAPADMKSSAAADAALKALANGIVGGTQNDDASFLEKSSWTYELQTGVLR